MSATIVQSVELHEELYFGTTLQNPVRYKTAHKMLTKYNNTNCIPQVGHPFAGTSSKENEKTIND